MNCPTAQRRLFAADRPDAPPADVRRHLAECAACRAAARRLAQAERLLPRLPVPATAARADLLQKIMAPASVSSNGLIPLVRPGPLTPPTPPKERGQRKLAWAVAIAATLALFALGWSLWPKPQPHIPESPKEWPVAIQWRQQRDNLLAAPGAPRERVQGLDKLAAEVQEKARAVARDGDAAGLADAAKFYEELVREFLVKQAAALPIEDRALMRTVADRLGRDESDFRSAAAVSPHQETVAALNRLADVARDGSRDLSDRLRAA
jgi:hypothetical protein